MIINQLKQVLHWNWVLKMNFSKQIQFLLIFFGEVNELTCYQKESFHVWGLNSIPICWDQWQKKRNYLRILLLKLCSWCHLPAACSKRLGFVWIPMRWTGELRNLRITLKAIWIIIWRKIDTGGSFWSTLIVILKLSFFIGAISRA